MKKSHKLFSVLILILVFFIPKYIFASTLTVNSLLDDGDGTCTSTCTFRDAIANAGDGDTITFSVTGVIALDNAAEMLIDQDITIEGPGQNNLTIDFSDDTDNFIHLNNGAGEINISGLTFTHGPGGIFYEGSAGGTYNISDVTFTHNDGGYDPVTIYYGDWNFTNVTFSNNSVDWDCCGYTPAILLDGDGTNNLTITGSTFDSNQHGHGVIYAKWFDTFTITNSTFANNSVAGNGRSGGLYLSNDGDVHIINSTFYNNVNANGYPTINAGSDSLDIVNSIVYSITDDNCNDSVTSLGHNIESGTTCGFSGEGDLSSTDALLGSLANNGGPVRTMALLTGSPALDTAKDSSAPATDARGTTRPQGSHSDIGAFELAVATQSTPVSTPPPDSGMIVGSGPSAPSREGIPGYVKPRPQIVYPDGHIVYLDEPALFTPSTQIQTPIVPVTGTTTPELIPDFPNIISPNSINSAVKSLQIALNFLGFTISTNGPGSVGNETNKFGSLTLKAVQKFQCTYSIVCSGTPSATGYGQIGPNTRAKINNLLTILKK